MTALATTSILLVEDHSVIATSLAMALRASGFASVNSVDPDDVSVGAVLAAAGAIHADIALVDLRTGDGQLAVTMVGPLVALGSKVLLIAGGNEPDAIAAGLGAGAEAIIDRAMSFERLVATLVDLANGRELMTPEERSALLEFLEQRDGAVQGRRQPFVSLTAREAQVLRRLIDGTSPKQIALSEGLSISTVRGHIERILTKLGVSNQREALALAREAGWPPAADIGHANPR